MPALHDREDHAENSSVTATAGAGPRMSLLFSSLDASASGVQKVRWHCAKARQFETVEAIASACQISLASAHGAIQTLIAEGCMAREYPLRRNGRFTTKQRYRWVK